MAVIEAVTLVVSHQNEPRVPEVSRATIFAVGEVSTVSSLHHVSVSLAASAQMISWQAYRVF
jgi:hypothetical protein